MSSSGAKGLIKNANNYNGLDTEITTDTKDRDHTQPIAKAHLQQTPEMDNSWRLT
jgi:hypothetical protein